MNKKIEITFINTKEKLALNVNYKGNIDAAMVYESIVALAREIHMQEKSSYGHIKKMVNIGLDCLEEQEDANITYFKCDNLTVKKDGGVN